MTGVRNRHCTSHGCTLCPAPHGGNDSPRDAEHQTGTKHFPWEKVAVCALLQEMVFIPSSPHSPAQGSAKACLGLGHIYAGEERGPGLCGCCAVCQVAQDAFEFIA